MIDRQKLEETAWDVVVIGTGMGGATLGYALAKKGKKVLFLEKGKSFLENQSGIRGVFAESLFAGRAKSEYPDILKNAGRVWDRIHDVSGKHPRSFVPFIGAGAGGSTLLYSATLQRFFPEDFTPRKNYPQTKDSSIPDAWPISYAELEPYYEQAETLYRVRGVDDSTTRHGRPIRYNTLLPSLSKSGKELFDFFSKKGLHPYQLPVARENIEACGDCQGKLCTVNCKNDSGQICLKRAIEEYGAILVTECEVMRLEADKDKVTGVLCRYQGETMTISGTAIVLSAGALTTPYLLLSSTSDIWPQGLANRSGLVGKNLMRHFIDLYTVLPHEKPDKVNPREVGFNDFYLCDKGKFGTVQNFGAFPPVETVSEEFKNYFGAFLAKIINLGVVFFLHYFVKGHLIFASITEDLPYEDNAVFLDETTKELSFRYHIHKDDALRIKTLRGILSGVFKPYRFILMKQAESNDRMGHVCGTCRFGDTPTTSVLDRNNRAHDVTNLFVVDGSFFPSSGGTNPSLTIAANALRVADHMLKK